MVCIGHDVLALRDSLLDEGVAVSPAAAEGELSYLAHSVLKDELGLKHVFTVLPEENEIAKTAGISELGPLLLYLVLFFILGEATWARMVSRRRT